MAMEKPPAAVGTKLKDSCDACSAFKVKCTKEKPICSRCCKMKRSCLYSPARRAGRPHRSSSSFTPKAQRKTAGTIATANSMGHGGDGPGGILRAAVAINQQHHHHQQALVGVGTGGYHGNIKTTSARSLYPSLTLGSGSTGGGGWADLQPPLTPWPESMMGEAPLSRPLPATNSTTTTTTSCSSAGAGAGGAVRTSAMTPSPSSCCSVSPPGTEPATMPGTSAAAATGTSLSGVCGGASNNADCSSIALDILESLAATRQFLPGSSSPGLTLTGQGISVDDSIKVMSQILICPCSQRREVAMLSASVCTTLMDMLQHGLGHLTCASQLAQMTQQLHHMANLVAQFSGRYYADGLREDVEARMASALKLRLRGLVNMVSGAMLRTGDSLR